VPEFTSSVSESTVYIYNCKNSVIQVKGKVNGTGIDKCSKNEII
jgi:hypothetical protein